MQTNITELLQIPQIQSNLHYWMIRTNGGDYFDDFVLHQYIAISWDSITLNILNTQNEDSIKNLIESFVCSNPSEYDNDLDDISSSKSKITSIYNKLCRFVFEINVGDIVLIPNKNSEKIMIAKVIGPTFEDTNYIEKYFNDNPDTELNPCPYHKRRNIEPLKIITKRAMDIYLLKGLNSHHALSCLDEYSTYIDRTIYPIYQKGDEIHSTIHAGHPNGLSLREMTALLNNICESIDDIAHDFHVEIDPKDIGLKLNFHSPGLLELIGYGSLATMCVSAFIFTLNNLINGGNFSLSFKHKSSDIEFSIESKTDGILGSHRKNKELELKKAETYMKLIKDLDIKKDPALFAAILNNEKINLDQISSKKKNKKSH